MLRKKKPLFDAEPAGLAGINQLFAKDIAPHLPKLERLRKLAILRGHVGAVLAVIPFAFLGAGMLVCMAASVVIELGSLTFVSVLNRKIRGIWNGLYAGAKRVKLRHRHLVLHALARQLGIIYHPDGIEEVLDRHKDHGLLPTGRRMDCEDGFDGYIEGTRFQMTEAEVLVHRANSDAFGDSVEFRGICLSVRVPKRFEGRTVVMSGEADWQPVRRGALWNQQEVRLESTEFSKMFKVFADDQIESRYLLTPSVMERLLSVTRIHPDLTAVFADGGLHITFSCPDAFNAGTYKSRLTDPALVREALEDLLYAGSIVADLSVNERTRI